MSLVQGTPVNIVAGRNKGSTGTFICYVGGFMCRVALTDGAMPSQRFRTTSVQAIIVAVQIEQAVMHVVMEQPNDREGPQDPATLENALNEVETLKNALIRLDRKLRSLQINN
jgi:hypothetical protein